MNEQQPARMTLKAEVDADNHCNVSMEALDESFTYTDALYKTIVMVLHIGTALSRQTGGQLKVSRFADDVAEVLAGHSDYITGEDEQQ